MNDKTAEVLKHIADKLDVPVQQLWAGLVAYAPFIFWQWVAGCLAAMFIVIVCSWLCVRTTGSEISARTDGMVPGLFGLVAIVAFVIGLGTGIEGMPNALAAKYAPEAWATVYIMKFVRR